MSGRFLLDTNVVIGIFAQDVAVQTRIASAAEVFVPVTVLGELYYGAHKSTRVKANLERIEEFAASNTILMCDTETARQYGEIKNGLRARGRPIPENDIWIAAIAKQYGLTVGECQEFCVNQLLDWPGCGPTPDGYNLDRQHVTPCAAAVRAERRLRPFTQFI